MLRFACAVAVLLLPSSALAARATVTTVWGERIEGELLEGEQRDYLLLRTDDGQTRVVRWHILHSYRVHAPDPHKIPWDSRLTIGARIGTMTVGVEKLNGYVSGGLVFGATVGWAFSRTSALVAAYEGSFPDYDQRNRGASAQLSNFVGGGAQFRANGIKSPAGVYFEALFGLRTLAYKFSPSDGSSRLELPSGPMTERASLYGWEARFAFGAAITVTRSVSFDVFSAIGVGQLLHYSDTLDCRTFARGPCGSHRFPITNLGIYVAVRYQ